MGLFDRIYRIAKANTLHRVDDFLSDTKYEEWVSDFSDTAGDFFKSRSGTESSESSNKNKSDGQDYSYSSGTSSGSTTGEDYFSGVPRQVAEDLAVFGLKPPSSLDEIKAARNREIKKVHPDKFMNDPEKLDAAKEIMQTYNAAYDRLKKHYKK